MNKRTRNIPLTHSPDVTHDSYAGKITIVSGSWSGSTRNVCRGDLDVYCAAVLIRKLRRALRDIRSEQLQRMYSVIADAEGEV